MLDQWAYETDVRLQFIEPASPSRTPSSNRSIAACTRNALTSMPSSRSTTCAAQLSSGATDTTPSDLIPVSAIFRLWSSHQAIDQLRSESATRTAWPAKGMLAGAPRRDGLEPRLRRYQGLLVI